MHFFTVVLFPKDIPTEASTLRANLEAVLEPFNENRRVPAYRVPCDCINEEASGYASKYADLQALKTIDAYRDEYHKIPFDSRPEWKVFTAEWWAVRDEAERNHAMYQKPDPKCEDCLGMGKALSTYNPRSKWDWWRVGGRYDGRLIDNPQESDDGFNFDERHQTFDNNMALVSALPNGYAVCYAVLTSDGEWIDREIRKVTDTNPRGEYGGTIPDDEWDAKLRKIFAKHVECLAIGCDMHI